MKKGSATPLKDGPIGFFSLRTKIIILVGLLFLTAAVIMQVSVSHFVSKAISQTLEDQLKIKASDAANILTERINADISVLETIALLPLIRSNAPMQEKVALLKTLRTGLTKRTGFVEFGVLTKDGVQYATDDTVLNLESRKWVQEALAGRPFFSDPIMPKVIKEVMFNVGVPIRDDQGAVIGAVAGRMPVALLSNAIDIEKTSGSIYVVNDQGQIITNKDIEKVITKENIIEMAKTDALYAPAARFISHAIDSDQTIIGTYSYSGKMMVAANARIVPTNWSVIAEVPQTIFSKPVRSVNTLMSSIAWSILLSGIIILFIIATKMLKPLNTVVNALKNISEGEGDLTVRLTISGKDEIAQLCRYFNRTIAKINGSVRSVSLCNTDMQEIGGNLVQTMHMVAKSIDGISAGISQVQQQSVQQATSISETVSTTEQIIRTIQQLNASIEKQASSVSHSASAVEEMVANIISIGQTLSKTDGVISTLSEATISGRETLTNSNSITQKLAEESGSLLEASTVIQHIASQTNLLAMNAAIEAAHAGEAGKGFAVVADEIRKLAEESSLQGKAITSTLKSLSTEIDTLSSSAQTVEEKFSNIFDLARSVKQMSLQITAAMKEQELGSKEILTAMDNINTITATVQTSSADMLKGGELVAGEMAKLDTLATTFSEQMVSMTAGTTQITNAVQEVMTIARKNRESLDKLSSEMNKFKV